MTSQRAEISVLDMCELGLPANDGARRAVVISVVSEHKNPPERGFAVSDQSLFANDDFAFDLNLNTTMRLQAGDQLLAVLLVADDARNRLGLAHAEGLILSFGTPLLAR